MIEIVIKSVYLAKSKKILVFRTFLVNFVLVEEQTRPKEWLKSTKN